MIRNPNNPQVHRMLAFYQARLGNREPALNGIQEALRIDPKDIHTIYRAGYLYELVGERDLAVEFFTRSLNRGISNRELCDNKDLEGLRKDVRIAELLEGKCKRDKTAFVCPEDRPLIP